MTFFWDVWGRHCGVGGTLEKYGGFLKWWYPASMGFPTKNDHFVVFWGYHHLRKHPYHPCSFARQSKLFVVGRWDKDLFYRDLSLASVCCIWRIMLFCLPGSTIYLMLILFRTHVGVFLHGVPPFHTPKWSFLVGKPMGLLGKPTILGFTPMVVGHIFQNRRERF